VEITNPVTAQALVQALADEYSRKIMLSTIPSPKSVEDLSTEDGIPLSTCYRKVTELTEDHILVVERMIMTPAGKKYAIYRATIEGVHVDMGPGSLNVTVKPNPEAAAKLQSAWLASRLEANSH